MAEHNNHAWTYSRNGVEIVLGKSPEQLLVAAVRSAGDERPRGPRWTHVQRMFAVGSTYAAALCRLVGLDPDEEIGSTEWERLECALGLGVGDLDEERWRTVTECDPPPESERGPAWEA